MAWETAGRSPLAEDPAQDRRPPTDGGTDSGVSQLSARGWGAIQQTV